jgi:hypothetical protein
MKLKAISIDWIDSQTSYGWRQFDAREDGPPCKIKSIGWLVGETKDTVSISHACSQNGNFADFMTIPRVAIKKIKKVKL